MALVCPDTAEVSMLKLITNNASNADLKLKLFTTDVTPDDDTVLVDLTEASGNGYAAKTLTGASWAISTSVGVTTASYAEQTFTFTGALGNVYGYFITNGAGDELLWCERFTDAPYDIVNNGDEINVTVKITLA